MKITFALPGLDLTGGCRVVSIYAERLRRRGHDVRVVVPRHPQRTPRQVVRDLLKQGRLFALQPQVDASHFKDLDVDVRFVGWADAVAGRAFPEGDVLIATWWETMEWVDAAPAHCGAKAYFIQHHEVFGGPLDRVQATYRMGARKITIARWISDVLRNDYGMHDVAIVPNAVDHDLFTASMRARQPRPTVGFVYSPIGFKGSEIALEAIRAVASARPNLRVVAFGSQPPLHELPEHFEFHLRPAQPLIPQLYRSCDVWICPSHSEGFNLPAMEAMACGTPVVSTRTGWPEEAIDQGINGYLVDVGDVDAMSRRTLDVLDANDDDWTRMSEAAQATARRESWEASTVMFEENLEKAVSTLNCVP